MPNCGDTHRRTGLLLGGPDRLEKWTYRNFIELSKGKHEVLHLGPNTPLQWSSCLAEGQYGSTGLGDPQESAVTANCLLGYIRKSVAGRLRDHFCVALESTSGMLCLVLVFLVQDMLIHEDCHDD